MDESTSVIIVTFNGRTYLEGCLSSVGEQLGPGDELIAVDNASTDGTAERIKAHFPGVRLVQNAENRGFAAACNQGAARASGEVLVFLNQDTRVAPGWLQALVDGLGEGEGTGLTTSQVLLMSQPDRIQLCGQDVHYTGLVFNRGFLGTAGSLVTPGQVGAVSGASFALRRELWQALGGFDERFYLYYEETDLSWRARLAGYRCRFVPGSVAYHDYRPARPNPLQLYYSARNRYLTLLKNWRWGTLLLLLPALLLAELLEWALAFRGGWPGAAAKLRANLWLLTHLGQIRGLHTAAQAGRQVSDTAILRERGHRLEPAETEVGAAGRGVLALCNRLFLLNHRLALGLCQRLGR